MTQLEQELAWLTIKVARGEDLAKKLEDYFYEHHDDWEKGIRNEFFKRLEAFKDDLYYAQSRLEKLGWQVIMERDANFDVYGIPLDRGD